MYFQDAVVFWSRALQLDLNLKPLLTSCLDRLAPEKAPKKLRDGYREARRWVNWVRSWETVPEIREFMQFLHPDLNGPEKCKETCNSNGAPQIAGIRIVPTFGAR